MPPLPDFQAVYRGDHGEVLVDDKKCVGCKMCMRVGCPAISVADGKASIDATLRVGCDLCMQMCKPGAIQKTEVR